jgi:YD repeat-containing protein
MPHRLVIIFLLLSALAAAPLRAQQPGVTTRYVYDANGRLRAVITPEGAAVYEYDPAGNFTRIRRLTPDDCEALEFSPRQGPPGTPVTIYGVGIGQATAVTFNGRPAAIGLKAATSIVAAVPDGAETGPIVVMLPCGPKTFPAPFTVSGVRVAPATIAVSPNRTAQFTAAVAGVTDAGVTWSVDGVPGGNETAGTINEGGLYTAPAQASSTTTHVIRATSVVEPALFGEAQARVTAGGYEFLARGVSVRYGTPPDLVVAYAATPVAVRYGPPDPQGKAFIAAPVAVRYESVNPTAPTSVTAPVSVQYGTPSPAAPAYTASGVAVAYGPSPNTGSVGLTALVSAARGASISSLSAAAFAKGTTTTLTFTGGSLREVTGIQFLRADGSPDAEIRVTELQASPDGLTLRAKVSVTGTAAAGPRLLRVTTAAGGTSSGAPGLSLIQIIP